MRIFNEKLDIFIVVLTQILGSLRCYNGPQLFHRRDIFLIAPFAGISKKEMF